MTDLRSALEKYLSMRKGLGYKYEHQTRRLGDFVAFMEKRKATTITTKIAMECKRGGGDTLCRGGGLVPDVVHGGGRRHGEAVFADRERSYD